MLLSKRIVEGANVTKKEVTVNGHSYEEFTLTNRSGVLMELKLGLKNIHPVLLLGPVRTDDEGNERYIPYTIFTKATLDANSDDYIKSIMGNVIFYTSGYSIHLFGLYYDDLVHGCGMLASNEVKVQEDGTVTLEPKMLARRV